MGKKRQKKHKKASPSKSHQILENTSLISVDSGPASRQWPEKTIREKIKKKLSAIPADKTSQEQYFLMGIINFYHGGLQDNPEKVNEGVKKLITAASGESPYAPAFLELSWINCFYDLPKGTTDYSEQAVKELENNPEAWKFRVINLWKQGNKELCFEALEQYTSLDPQGSAQLEMSQRFKSGSNLTQGSGLLFTPPEFGNLHHPPAINPEQLRFNFFILNQCLQNESENTDLLMEAALHSFFLHENDKAKSYLEEIIKIDKNNVDAFSLYGHILEAMGDMNAAEQANKKVLKQVPGHPLANTNLAKIFQVKGMRIQAETLLSIALENAPEYAEALSLYGNILSLQEGEEARSLEYQKRALRLEPEVPDYHINFCLTALQTANIDLLRREWNYHKKYIQAFTQNSAVRKLISLVLMGAKDPMQDVALAEMLNKNGMTRSARIFVQRAWKRRYKVEETKRPEFYYYMGMHAAQSNEQEIALEAYKALQETDQAQSHASILVAHAMSRLGRHEEAISIIEKSGETSGGARSLAGDIYWSAGKYQEALKFAKEAGEQDNVEFMGIFRGLKYAILQRDAATAAEILETGLKKWPDSTQLLALSGEISNISGKYEETIKTLKARIYQDGKPTVIQIDPNADRSAENLYAPYFVLGSTLLLAEKSEDLNELLQWIHANLPDLTGEWETLQAEFYRKQSQFKEAVQSISKANRSFPALLTKALCELELGNLEEAESIANQILKDTDRQIIWSHPAGGFFATSQYIMAAVNRKRDNFSAAEEAAAKGIALDAEHPGCKEILEQVPVKA
ncbi:MAG: hypothetical protein HQK83_02065 [Fibrobacteria bacterium]|nr:hypothetical protein [Fibrobacteria bacterium]